MCYYMHKSGQYTMKYYFVNILLLFIIIYIILLKYCFPILYDLGCIWVPGVHFHVFEIAYL